MQHTRVALPALIVSTLVVSAMSLTSCHRRSSSPAPAALDVERLDLRTAIGSQVAMPVGVTVDPDTGRLYVLDELLGLYGQLADGSFELIADAGDLMARAGPSSPFTDVAALGGGRFALTAVNDGFLLNAASGDIRQHFCYVPGFVINDPDPLGQLTRGLTWDPVRELIIAQPITVELDTGNSRAADVGTFPVEGGAGEDWHPIPDRNFLAGGLAVDGEGRLWLGYLDTLFQYDLATDRLSGPIRRLSDYGVTEISGMAIDGADMLILDAPSQSLLRVAVDSL